ncbi:hypothetical protein BDZ89DRAFT_1059153 [Hymenopellis radicata]|nr:hypothetical protein BDZ89DRAFT_1059153 [Hymenopellis radicata]
MFSLALLWSGGGLCGGPWSLGALDRSWLVCDFVLHQTAWHLTARVSDAGNDVCQKYHWKWSRKLKSPEQDILTNDACYFKLALMRKCTAFGALKPQRRACRGGGMYV